ncbi:universal stress protein [Mucilaginibacter sp.]|uniref:universal stress protein n=1 Tax=Mucilaginibacter sp. TaxID=1882438 RepID=UPI003D0D0C74
MEINRILIGIDDSKYAEHAAEYGFELARKFNAAVGLVNIVEPVVISQATPGIDPLMGSALQSNAFEEMEILDIQKDISGNMVDATIKKYGEGLQVTHFTEYGSTADGIINCSSEFAADLIVLGTHSRSGFDRLFMGSIAEDVVRHSEIPVLVVPFKEAKAR